MVMVDEIDGDEGDQGLRRRWMVVEEIDGDDGVAEEIDGDDVGAVQFPFVSDGGFIGDLHMHLLEDAVSYHT
ncbi:hypothetical protein R6Q59_004012 [Mikania micrantha]